MIRGPGVVSVKAQKSPAVITLDIAPTLIDIAGLNHTDYGMDGVSWWSNILKSHENSLDSNSAQDHLSRHFLIEYHGEGKYILFNKRWFLVCYMLRPIVKNQCTTTDECSHSFSIL